PPRLAAIRRPQPTLSPARVQDWIGGGAPTRVSSSPKGREARRSTTHDGQKALQRRELHQRTQVPRAPAVRRDVARQAIPHAGKRLRHSPDGTRQTTPDPVDGK